MRIERIYIEKLFGMFNHEVCFNLDDRISIIHGPNGVGKTTILRLIDAVLNKQGEELRAIPFDELKMDFDDGSKLSIKNRYPIQSSKQSLKNNNDQFVFNFHKKGQKSLSWETNLRFDPREYRLPVSIIDRIIPNLDRVSPVRWQDSGTGEMLSLEQVVLKFGHLLPPEFRDIEGSWPNWFNKYLGDISVRFVRAQRLLLLSRESESTRYRSSSDEEMKTRVSEAVLSYSSQLRDIIRQRLAESSLLSQSLDRTFPQRLIDSYKNEIMVPQDELIERLKNIEKKRNFLIDVGLYDPEKVDIPTPEVDDEHIRRVLSVYAKDAEAKLGIFDELASKIDLLVKLINSRFKYKQMRIDKEKGFVFETERGLLSPANLSSGEQHELVLTYELLFQTKKDTLVLIDEPELSLHVGWQIRFLEDLQQIINLAQVYALVATHSPQIINNRWDLTIKLGAGEDDR